MRNVANDVKKTRQMYVGAILKEKSYKNARLRKIARNAMRRIFAKTVTIVKRDTSERYRVYVCVL